MFKKKKKPEENYILLRADEAKAAANEQMQLMLNGHIRLITKEINAAIRKGKFHIIIKPIPFDLEDNNILLKAVCNHFRQQGYIVNSTPTMIGIFW